MNINKNRVLLVLFLVLPVILLSGCKDADWDLLEVAFEAWAEHNDLMEGGRYKPEGVVQKAVENTIADITNQEESIQLDGLNVIKDIEKADALAGAAIAERNPTKMDEAIDLRPKDWRLQEQNGLLQSLEGDIDQSMEAMEESNWLLLDQVKKSGNCTEHHLEQLEYRRDLYEVNLEKCSQTPGCETLAFEAIIDSTSDAIWQIHDLGYSESCGNMP